MKRTARKVGGSIYVALTAAAIEALDIKENDKLDVRVKDKTIVIKKVKGDK